LLKTYQDLFRISGAFRVVFSGFIARLPIAMDSIAIIYFVQSVERRYFIAGALTAVAALTTVISTPLWAKAADKYGQRKVLFTAIPIRSLSFLIFIELVLADTPKWIWFICIIFAESASVSMGSLSRRRWVHLIDVENKALLSTAYTFESLMDEFIFILGPILTTVIVTLFDPKYGILFGIFFLLFGGSLLGFHKISSPSIIKESNYEKLDSVFKNKKLQAIALPLTLAGGSFSAINICVVAFTDERAIKSVSGLLLGIWAFGGATSALINGAVNWRASHGNRFIFYLFGMTIVSLSFPFVTNVWFLGVVLFLQGMCIAPLLPNGLPLITATIPESRLTQAITLTTAGIPLTGALGSFFAGKLIDSYGASTGLWLPFIFLLGSSAVALLYFKEYRG
jgi:MFS family permease